MNFDDHLHQEAQNHLRLQDAEPEYKVCPDCNGDPEQMSECCYAPIDSDILVCSECKEHSSIAVCETCGGEGRIEI